MIRYLLEFGNNKKLSLAEGLSYIEKNGINNFEINKNYLIFLADKEPIVTFGSILRIARYLCAFDEIESVFEKEFGFSEKIIWSIYPLDSIKHGYTDLYNKIKFKFKTLSKKSVYVSPLSFVDDEKLSVTRGLRKRLDKNGIEIVVTKSDKILLWQTLHYLELNNFRKRDFFRPYKRPEISIPPSLARTMINLAQPRIGSKLLDPFCGTGTILLEAIDEKLNVFGVDINPKNVSGSLLNIAWFNKKSFHNVVCGDSLKLDRIFSCEMFDCIVTEPPFGPPFKKPPKRQFVEKLRSELETFYQKALDSMSCVLKKTVE